MSYRPLATISGPAYSPWFKLLATLFTFGLGAYGVSFALRFPLLTWGAGVIVMMATALMLLALSFVGFLRSTTTIDDRGIVQTWVVSRQVLWDDVRSAKLIGVPHAGWLSPPRLVVRTGTAFHTFNGGTAELLAEFARISLAYEPKRDD
ncbi:MAG: putative Membrane protein [Pseudomonadota bacterium]|jgi:hypothetical protein